MTDPQARKEKNIALLQQEGVPTIDHLPFIESADEVRHRTTEEIARRALACLLAVQVACDIANENDGEESAAFFQQLAERYDVTEDFTPLEQQLMAGELDREKAIAYTWKYEAVWPLFWALGLVEELDYPDEICDCDLAISLVTNCSNLEEFLQRCSLRDIEVILDEADRIFRYDWACVEARIHGEDAPANLNPDLVMERHWGLNWLIDADGENDWDHVSTNT